MSLPLRTYDGPVMQWSTCDSRFDKNGQFRRPVFWSRCRRLELRGRSASEMPVKWARDRCPRRKTRMPTRFNAPYRCSRVMNQAGRRATQSSPQPPVHNSARPDIFVVRMQWCWLDEKGNTRRSDYESLLLPCDGRVKVFESVRCAGD